MSSGKSFSGVCARSHLLRTSIRFFRNSIGTVQNSSFADSPEKNIPSRSFIAFEDEVTCSYLLSTNRLPIWGHSHLLRMLSAPSLYTIFVRSTYLLHERPTPPELSILSSHPNATPSPFPPLPQPLSLFRIHRCSFPVSHLQLYSAGFALSGAERSSSR